MRMLARVCAIGLALAAPAAAQKVGDNQVTGFVTSGSGELSGRVLDSRGKPARGIQVHLAPATGKPQVVTTDAQGRYRAQLTSAEYTMVFVHGDYKLEGQAAVATKEGDDEAIAIREVLPPHVQPRPKSNPLAIPPYSDVAIERNAWTRAWVMLDIDERGVVTHVKVLNRPGYGLDAIALREAFALRFEPARDRADRPTRTILVWNFEWPAYWWMRQNKHDLRRIPREALEVPCLGQGPARSVYRDCSKPDIAAAVSQPWRDKP